MTDDVLTASTPIIVAEDGREAIASVVGLQMSYPFFYDTFINMSKTSDDSTARDLNLTCESAVSDKGRSSTVVSDSCPSLRVVSGSCQSSRVVSDS